jgi:hypothetical protein
MCLLNTLAIVGINNKDKPLCVLELGLRKTSFYQSVLKYVMSPERPDLILTADIPNSKVDVLIFNSFNVET